MTGKTSEASTLLPNGETLYEMLFQNSLDGLMLTAPDGSILDANPAACRILERTREEIVREGRQGLIDSADPRLAVLIAERQRTGNGRRRRAPADAAGRRGARAGHHHFRF